MAKLTMDYTFTKGKFANKTVSELVDIKGQIFSMIKDGYEFDDEVLAAAHIKRNVTNVKTYCSVFGGNKENVIEKTLPKDTASMKQILSDINTLDHIGDNVNENDEISNEIDGEDIIDNESDDDE